MASKVLQSDSFFRLYKSVDFFRGSVPTPPISATSFCLDWTPEEHFWFLGQKGDRNVLGCDQSRGSTRGGGVLSCL